MIPPPMRSSMLGRTTGAYEERSEEEADEEVVEEEAGVAVEEDAAAVCVECSAAAAAAWLALPAFDAASCCCCIKCRLKPAEPGRGSMASRAGDWTNEATRGRVESAEESRMQLQAGDLGSALERRGNCSIRKA